MHSWVSSRPQFKRPTPVISGLDASRKSSITRIIRGYLFVLLRSDPDRTRFLSRNGEVAEIRFPNSRYSRLGVCLAVEILKVTLWDVVIREGIAGGTMERQRAF